MDKNQEHLNNLTEIRSLMEKSSTFISLSGLSGVSAGIIGLLSSIYVYFKIEAVISADKRNSLTYPAVTDDFIYSLVLTAGIVLVLTFMTTIFFTSRKAQKKGLPVWNSSAKRLVANLFIPLIAGGIFCLILIYHGLFNLLASAMLLFYGLALLNASKYTLSEIKFLGISEIILGLAAAFWYPYGLWFWAAGFGIMNIVYGVSMYVKYER